MKFLFTTMIYCVLYTANQYYTKLKRRRYVKRIRPIAIAQRAIKKLQGVLIKSGTSRPKIHSCRYIGYFP